MPPVAPPRLFSPQEKRTASRLITNDITRCTTELSILYSTEPRDELNVHHQESKLKWLSDKQVQLAFDEEAPLIPERRVHYTNLQLRAKNLASLRNEDELLRLNHIRAYCKNFVAIERIHHPTAPILSPEAPVTPPLQRNIWFNSPDEIRGELKKIFSENGCQTCPDPQCCSARAGNLQ
jgi:hypothetical protein